MKLEQLKTLEKARTAGPWDIKKDQVSPYKYCHMVNESGDVLATMYTDNHYNNATFFEALVNSAADLLAVVEAARDLSNLWKKMAELEADKVSPRAFWNLMQKYCDEYGALKIRLARLEGAG